MQIETIQLNPCKTCGRVPVVECKSGSELYAAGCHGSMIFEPTARACAEEWNAANPVQATPKLNPCRVCGERPYVSRNGECWIATCHGPTAIGVDELKCAEEWNNANPLPLKGGHQPPVALVAPPPPPPPPEPIRAYQLNPCSKCGNQPAIEPRINGVRYRCCKVELFELNEITAINFWNLINPNLQK